MLRLASPVNSAMLSRVALAIGLVLSIYATAHAATLSPESAQTDLGLESWGASRKADVMAKLLQRDVVVSLANRQ